MSELIQANFDLTLNIEHTKEFLEKNPVVIDVRPEA